MGKNGVICAIDVNDYDQDVIDLAATFAKHLGVDLDLLHVTAFPISSDVSWPSYRGTPDAIITDDLLFQKVGTTIDGVQLWHHHLSGLPTREILKFVESRQPPLLVMGTHSRQGLSRIFGSVAAKIMRHVRCPVMVLRQQQSSRGPADAKA